MPILEDLFRQPAPPKPNAPSTSSGTDTPLFQPGADSANLEADYYELARQADEEYRNRPDDGSNWLTDMQKWWDRNPGFTYARFVTADIFAQPPEILAQPPEPNAAAPDNPFQALLQFRMPFGELRDSSFGEPGKPNAPSTSSGTDTPSDPLDQSVQGSRRRFQGPAQQPTEETRQGIGLLERTMAFFVNWGGFSEFTYNTPLPGVNTTGAHLTAKGIELHQNTAIMNQGARLAWLNPDLTHEYTTGGRAGVSTAVSNYDLAIQYSDPDYWGMTPEQATEFAMAPRGLVGMKQPWFNNQMLPNPNANQGMSDAELMRYQAEWILNRDRDVETIATQAAILLQVAQSDIDHSQDPLVVQLLKDLGIPTPEELTQRQTQLRGDPIYRQGKILGYESSDQPLIPAFDSLTTQALLQQGYTRELIASFADPERYAAIYNTPEFFDVLASVRTVDALERTMGLHQVQDQAIPLLNQMGFDIALGTDTLIGLLGDAFGISGKMLRAGAQLGILEDATTPTAAEKLVRKAAGESVMGPLTEIEAARRLREAKAAGRTPSSWRFLNDTAQTVANLGGNVKRAAQAAAGVGMAGFGAFSMWSLGTGDDPSMDSEDRITALTAGSGFGMMGMLGVAGMTRQVAANLAGNRATVGELSTAEANRTFNNVRLLRNRDALAETATYQRYMRESAGAWSAILRDERPRYVIDIETTLKGGDIFQVALRPLEGGDTLEWLIKPPSGVDAGLDASKEAYQRAMQSGMSQEQAMQEIGQALGGSAILIGHNVAGFDLPRLLKAGLQGDYTPVDTLAMALHAGVQTPTNELTLGALFKHFTGSELTGAHDASVDIAATAEIYNQLKPAVSRGIGEELARLTGLNLPETPLAELNPRALPGSLSDLLRRQETTYRIEDRLDAVYAAFPGLSQAKIIEKIQTGDFQSFEQYLAVYGKADGAVALEALTHRETEFYRQRGQDFNTALQVYEQRAKKSILNRIWTAEPQYSVGQVENVYSYLLSQYEGYSPIYLADMLPSLPYRENTSSAPFWAELLSRANYQAGAPNMPAPQTPGPKAMSPLQFLEEIRTRLGTQEAQTPETYAEMIEDALGVAERAGQIKLNDLVAQKQYVAWLEANPQYDIRRGLTAEQWQQYGDTPIAELPAKIQRRLLGEPQEPLLVAKQSREVYDNRGGTASLPTARHFKLPGATGGQDRSNNPVLDALRSRMTREYGRNLYGAQEPQVIDALQTVLDAADDFGVELSPTARWAYEMSQELLLTAGDSNSEMLRIAADPNDPDILNKLLALNELGPQTGIRVDLRGMRSRAVIDPETNLAQFMLEVPISYVDEWNPRYSYANRPEDLTTAYLNIEMAQHQQRTGGAERALGLTTAAELEGVLTPGAAGQDPHPYSNFTQTQLVEAAQADTANLINEALSNISRGQGDRRLPGTYRNLTVSSGKSPETWNELAAAYAQNRIMQRVGLSADFDKTQAYGLGMDTGDLLRDNAANAGLEVTDAGQVLVGADADRVFTNINWRAFETQIGRNDPLQIGPAADPANPFTFDINNLPTGMQVTTRLDGGEQIGTIVSRLRDGSYRVAYERPAANTYPEAPTSAGVSFHDGSYTGDDSSAIFYRNVRLEDIADPTAPGSEMLIQPLRKAAVIAQDDTRATTAENSVEYQAQRLIYNLLLRQEGDQPVQIHGINKIDPEVLRRADEIMQQSRSLRGYFRGSDADTSINYFLDWDSYDYNVDTMLLRPGAPEVIEQGGRVRVDPYQTSSARSADYLIDRELNELATAPPSITNLQRRDTLSSLLDALSSEAGRGAITPDTITSARRAQTTYSDIFATAQEFGMTAILKSVTEEGGIEYALRPRIDTDPNAVNPETLTRLGERAGALFQQTSHQVAAAGGNTLAALRDSPYRIVLVTNQSAVGRGIITRETAEDINDRLLTVIREAGGRVDAVYMCPHGPGDGCDCRKPLPGLLLQAVADLDIDLSRSLMIGDALSDVQAGQAAGVEQSILLRTGRGRDQERLPAAADLPPFPIFDSLADALNSLIKSLP